MPANPTARTLGEPQSFDEWFDRRFVHLKDSLAIKRNAREVWRVAQDGKYGFEEYMRHFLKRASHPETKKPGYQTVWDAAKDCLPEPTEADDAC